MTPAFTRSPVTLRSPYDDPFPAGYAISECRAVLSRGDGLVAGTSSSTTDRHRTRLDWAVLELCHQMLDRFGEKHPAEFRNGL